MDKMSDIESRENEIDPLRQLECLIFMPSESDSESSVELRLEASPLKRITTYCTRTNHSEQEAEITIKEVNAFLSLRIDTRQQFA